MNHRDPTPPAQRQRDRIERALGLLEEVLRDWDEDDVVVYPPTLPSFDELLSDLAAQLRSIRWRDPARHCKACGSEIIETINDSAFRDGECGGCEYARYRSHAPVLDCARALHGLIDGLQADGSDVFDDHEPLLGHCRAVLAEQARTFPRQRHEQAN